MLLSLDEANRVINEALLKHGLTNDDENYAPLLEDGDASVAQALLKILGIRHRMARVSTSWTNHLGESVSASLSLLGLEKATLAMDYEDTMTFLIDLHHDKALSPFIPSLLLKRAAKDPAFAAKMKSDVTLLPVLLACDERFAEGMPDFYKPLTPEAKQFIRQDVLNALGFDASALTAYQQDVLAIHELMIDKELMLKQVDSLEEEVEAAIRTRNPDAELPLQPLKEDIRLFKKSYAKEEGKPLLFTFFKNWAKENGFEDVIRLLDVKSDKDFIDHMEKRRLFKDPAFGGKFHGAWTHLIQWYCIVSAYKSGELKLSQPPAKVLQAMGKNADARNSLWDNTFEAGSRGLVIGSDFRSVRYFNDYINNNETFAKRCPTLQAMIKYRALKDEEKQLKK